VPRIARLRSSTGIYHIILRGNNRQAIFEDEEDYQRFLQILHKYRDICDFRIYAYCLMSNHLHLLIRQMAEPIETIMRRICSSYVLWFNKKYERIGYLFQDRYKSEPVEDERYFRTVIRYIFWNPVKAGIVPSVQDYKWMNYMDYAGSGNSTTDVHEVLGFLDPHRERARKFLVEFINQKNEDNCLDISNRTRTTDTEARRIILKHCKVERATDLQKMDIAIRNQYINELRKGYGISIRQIERITGISRGVIQRV